MRPLFALAALALSGCPDTDLRSKLPQPIPLAEALLVPTDDGILAFPVDVTKAQPLQAPVGFLGDPGDVADMSQRADGKIVVASAELTVDLPEGFILEPDGDFVQLDGSALNLADSAAIAQPRSVVTLPDLSALIVDSDIGSSIARFGPNGEDLGVLTEQLSFSSPVDAAVLGGQLVVVDSEQEPRLFRFQLDGTFAGAFAIDEEAAFAVIEPVAAAATAAGDVLFVADGLFNAVFAFNASGALLDFVAVDGIGDISDVAVLSNNFVVVADRGDSDLGITGGLRVFGGAGNLVQQISVPDLEGSGEPKIAVVRGVQVHPATSAGAEE